MDIWHVFSMLGGLALFLYGMNMMGEGLELYAGNRLQKILSKLTSNKFLGLLVGIVVTAIIQSSSATTVMVVGFVNSNLMTLSQAVNIIMGANIGTTITGQMIALNITELAPLIAFIGMVFFLLIRNRKLNYLGQVVFGLGILFMGMGIMSSSMAPLREHEGFINLMAGITNPFTGILIGAVVTAIIQSSSASLGILQALALQGLIPFETCMYIVLGQNIGTCITSVLASIGGTKNAKRAATSHVLFNIIGSVIFIAASFALPIAKWVEATSDQPMQQIANLHTIFNLVTTLMLFPFSAYLAKLSTYIIKGEDPKTAEKRLIYLNNTIGDNVVMITNAKYEILRMMKLCEENFNKACDIFVEFDEQKYSDVKFNEEVINYLNKEITKLNVQTLSKALGKQQSQQISSFLTITSNLERVGDYSINISELAKQSMDKELPYSDTSKEEVRRLQGLIDRIFASIEENVEADEFDIKDVYTIEYQVDSFTETYRSRHVERMKQGLCDTESGLFYDKFLSHAERVADHLVNVAEGFEIGDE